MFSTRLASRDWTVVTEFNCSTNPRRNRGAAIYPHLQRCHLVNVTVEVSHLNQSCADPDPVSLHAVFVFQRLHVSFGGLEALPYL